MILKQLKFEGVLSSNLSAYDILTLYTTLLHILIKEKITVLIEQFLIEMALFIWLVMRNLSFFTSVQPKNIICGDVRKCFTLSISF